MMMDRGRCAGAPRDADARIESYMRALEAALVPAGDRPTDGSRPYVYKTLLPRVWRDGLKGVEEIARDEMDRYDVEREFETSLGEGDINPTFFFREQPRLVQSMFERRRLLSQPAREAGMYKVFYSKHSVRLFSDHDKYHEDEVLDVPSHPKFVPLGTLPPPPEEGLWAAPDAVQHGEPRQMPAPSPPPPPPSLVPGGPWPLRPPALRFCCAVPPTWPRPRRLSPTCLRSNRLCAPALVVRLLTTTA